MSKYALSQQARQEIKEIWSFIARDDIEAADRWTFKFVEAFSFSLAIPTSAIRVRT